MPTPLLFLPPTSSAYVLYTLGIRNCSRNFGNTIIDFGITTIDFGNTMIDFLNLLIDFLLFVAFGVPYGPTPPKMQLFRSMATKCRLLTSPEEELFLQPQRLPATRFAQSSTCPSQRSKYTEGVARRMRKYVVSRD